jgi:hypothetical protein
MVAHISFGKPWHGKVPFWHIPVIVGGWADSCGAPGESRALELSSRQDVNHQK